MTTTTNYYKTIHKGIRAMLADLGREAGRVDWNDSADLTAFRAKAQQAFELLETHASLENAFIAPLLERYAPRVAAIIGSAHDEQEEILPALLRQLENFDSRAADAVDAGHTIVLRLTRFIAESLAHMADEEELAMPALRAAVDEAALADADNRLHAAIPPAAMAQVAPHLIPALNTVERLELVGGMKAAGAPAFPFAMQLASQLLSHDDYAALERGLAAEQAA